MCAKLLVDEDIMAENVSRHSALARAVSSLSAYTRVSSKNQVVVTSWENLKKIIIKIVIMKLQMYDINRF